MMKCGKTGKTSWQMLLKCYRDKFYVWGEREGGIEEGEGERGRGREGGREREREGRREEGDDDDDGCG